MSSNPTHGYDTTSTGTNNGNNNEGVIPAVLNYVGLGNNDQSDATAERAFGADVGPNASSGTGSRDGAVGGTTSTYGSNESTYGSNEGGLRADARVGDSDLTGGSSNSGRGSGIGSNSGSGSGYGSSSGYGAGSGTVTGVDPGEVGSEPHRQSGVGSGVGLDSSRGSGVGSGAGLGSERSGSGVPGSGSIAAGDELTASNKGNRAAAGESEGATAGEAQASTEQRSEYNKKPGKQQLENKSAIPTAGGVQLGEKHWGESDIIPDNPRPREDEGGVSSASGQPDQSTRDNTAANAGGPLSPSGSGGQKEGILDKVKDKLNIGNDSKQIGSDH